MNGEWQANHNVHMYMEKCNVVSIHRGIPAVCAL